MNLQFVHTLQFFRVFVAIGQVTMLIISSSGKSGFMITTHGIRIWQSGLGPSPELYKSINPQKATLQKMT